MHQNNNSYHRIKENLSLYGFGTTHSAHFQTIKELVENSIDALKVNTHTLLEPAITIDLILDIKKNNHLQIVVGDSGVGMNDPLNSFLCFSSNKSALITQQIEKPPQSLFSIITSDPPVTDVSSGESIKFMGKFGLGLYCIILYSTLNSQEPVRVITKTEQDINVKIADYVLDSIHQKVRMVQAKSVWLEGFTAGTRVAVYLPTSPLPPSLSETGNATSTFITQ